MSELLNAASMYKAEMIILNSAIRLLVSYQAEEPPNISVLFINI